MGKKRERKWKRRVKEGERRRLRENREESSTPRLPHGHQQHWKEVTEGVVDQRDQRRLRAVEVNVEKKQCSEEEEGCNRSRHHDDLHGNV